MQDGDTHAATAVEGSVAGRATNVISGSTATAYSMLRFCRTAERRSRGRMNQVAPRRIQPTDRQFGHNSTICGNEEERKLERERRFRKGCEAVRAREIDTCLCAETTLPHTTHTPRGAERA